MSNSRNLRGEWVKQYRDAVVAGDLIEAAAVVTDHIESDAYKGRSETARYPRKIAKLVKGLVGNMVSDGRFVQRTYDSFDVSVSKHMQRARSEAARFSLCKAFLEETSSAYVLQDPLVEKRMNSAVVNVGNRLFNSYLEGVRADRLQTVTDAQAHTPV